MRDFVDQVRERGGFDSAEEAERAIVATVEALGRQLMPTEAQLVAEGVPEPLAARLRDATHLGGGGGEAVFASVAAREGVGLGAAKEHVEVVLSVIGERLGAESRARLVRDLPGDLVSAFAPPPSTSAPPIERPARAAPERRTHAHSVTEANPHGETKLSSATGIAQERAHETIATGRPGSKRPLSEGES